ncbi:MAG: ParB N-terminal domain-containing protein [Euryarchaeota archaeon]|nr:ParB N-terminal domain-containing protein [Euryarchaeota archaeon]MBT4649950.1 ParB N-terminal domain-containing protein [Euryarchaeota archaeon]MBT6934682.1 ParB N-terminal domain-containing protein [Euryarchaeota archaeon]
MKVELVPLELLRPHEEIIIKKVDQLEKMTHRWNAYTKPLLLDRNTGTILDGHHRYEVALRLKLKCIPCVMIDYLDDNSIEVDVWPNCGREVLTKQDIINSALSGDLFSPKTSRHRLSDHLPPIAISLSRLREPAV